MASKNQLMPPPKTQGELALYLEKNARRLSAFQAIALIEEMLSQGREVGTSELAQEERLFFEVDHSLGFPLSDIVRITPIEQTRLSQLSDAPPLERYRMMVTFLGLHGSSTPLPSFYAEQIARYDRDESVSKAFFDFFHNRIIGFLYRSWRKFRYWRRYRPGADDLFSSWIYALFGLGSEQARQATPVYWPRLLCFAGMLSTRNRSPVLISRLITHAFDLPLVEIEQWVQRKITIPKDQRSLLGQANATLGRDFAIGDKAKDFQGKIRIVLRSLTFQRFQDFLPSGKDFNMLRSLIDFMLRDQLAYDFKLGLLVDEAHPITLSKTCQARLGWSSFLGAKAARSSRDVIIRVRR